MLRSGSDSRPFRELAGAPELLDRLLATLQRHAGSLGAPPDPAALQALSRARRRPGRPAAADARAPAALGRVAQQAPAESARAAPDRLAVPGRPAHQCRHPDVPALARDRHPSGCSRALRIARPHQHLAHHDALTGLPNRRLFEDRLIQALAVAARARRRLALLYLDLDGFKEINDSLGHRAGDELLRVVAERLATSVRGGDTIARLGGDEFAVIQIELRTATDAAILAERLMAAAAKPIRVGQQDLVIGASVGIALYPDDGGTADELRANADVALYSAKAAGRARMAYYRPDLTTEARTRGLLRATSPAASRRASSSCTTSPRSPPPTARSPVWKRSCVGTTRNAAPWPRAPSCPWPRRPA